MSIYLVGDLHGGAEGSMRMLNSKKFPEQKTLTKDDVLVQLGDFGYIWYNKEHRRYKEDKHWVEWFASRNYTTLIVPGNHENWDMINELPEIDKFGGKVLLLSTDKGDLFIAKAGEVYTIDSLKILCIPHARSTDRLNRVNGESWWAGEDITQAGIDNALDNLAKPENETIDYIFSHTMPDSMIDQFLHMTIQNATKFNDPTAKFLEHVWVNHDIRYGVHCGHFHQRYRFFRKTPHLNEHGRTVWSPDVDNNYVQCHYMQPPYLLEDHLM